jgi:hypothetical protein
MTPFSEKNAKNSNSVNFIIKKTYMGRKQNNWLRVLQQC